MGIAKKEQQVAGHYRYLLQAKHAALQSSLTTYTERHAVFRNAALHARSNLEKKTRFDTGAPQESCFDHNFGRKCIISTFDRQRVLGRNCLPLCRIGEIDPSDTDCRLQGQLEFISWVMVVYDRAYNSDFREDV